MIDNSLRAGHARAGPEGGSIAGRVIVALAAAVAIGLAACAPSSEDVPATDPGAAGMTIEVTSCQLDPVSAFVRITFEVTSSESRGAALLRGQVLDASGAALGEAPAAIQAVRSGQAVTGEVAVPLGQDPGGEVTCRVDLDVANP